jgi:RNA polymerase sigma factor (sigma-70 family)
MHPIQRDVSVEETPVALLYQRHAQAVLVYIRSRVSSKEDAEDLLLDVFLQAMKHKTPFYLSEGEQLTWLRHLARNRIIDRYRHHGRLPASSSLDNVSELLFADEEHDPEAQMLRRSRSDELLGLLAKLSPLQQTVLHLRFARDLSTREIAQQLQKSDGAIRTLLSRTLNLLRGMYEQCKEGE